MNFSLLNTADLCRSLRWKSYFLHFNIFDKQVIMFITTEILFFQFESTRNKVWEAIGSKNWTYMWAAKCFPTKTPHKFTTQFEDFYGVYTFWISWSYNALKLQYVFTWVTVTMNHSGVLSHPSNLLSVYDQRVAAVRKNRLRCELGVSVTASLENRNLMMGHLSHSKSLMGRCSCWCACV